MLNTTTPPAKWRSIANRRNDGDQLERGLLAAMESQRRDRAGARRFAAATAPRGAVTRQAVDLLEA
jgi:hypothetical protein